MVAQIDKTFVATRPGRGFGRLISYALFEGRAITTRGRWFNPITHTWLALMQRLGPGRPVENPVFIIGNGRSGTTILGRLLALHGDVGFLNEPKAIWHRLCRFEDVIGNYSNDSAHYRLSADDVNDDTVQKAHRLYGNYLKVVRAQRVVDKYPELVFRVPYVRKIFPDAKFLFIVRDGYDTVASVRNWQQRHSSMVRGVRHGWWGVDDRKWSLIVKELVTQDPDLAPMADYIATFSTDVDRAAVEWMLVVREGLQQMERFGDDILLLKHEDLVRDSTTCLESVFAFAQLNDDRAVREYAGRIVRQPPAVDRPVVDRKILPHFEEIRRSVGYGSI